VGKCKYKAIKEMERRGNVVNLIIVGKGKKR
jgi:hypothetical protein